MSPFPLVAMVICTVYFYSIGEGGEEGGEGGAEGGGEVTAGGLGSAER